MSDPEEKFDTTAGHQDIGALLADNQAMKAHIAELTLSLSSLAQAIGKQNKMGKKAQPKRPPEFSGRRGPDHISVKDWLFLCREYLQASLLVNEHEGVGIAGTMLTGPARSW